MKPKEIPASDQVIAQVAVDISLAHLDRLFDYLVPEHLIDQVKLGVLVKIRFAGQQVSGWVINLTNHTETNAKLAEILAVRSEEQIMTASLYKLIRAVADHYAGCFADVWRLAIPARHATTEKAKARQWPIPQFSDVPKCLSRYPNGEGFVELLATGKSPRAFWQIVPVHNPLGDWILGITEAANATIKSGRSVVVIVPHQRDLTRIKMHFSQIYGAGSVAILHTDLGASVRYRNYLACARGQARILLGTRAAIYAPMINIGLLVVLDDGDDLLSELRTPYPHVRDVAALRCAQQNTGLLYASYARSTEIQRWISRNWLVPIQFSAAEHRRISPVVRITGDSDYALAKDPLAKRLRLPSQAFSVLRDGLNRGPVLIQVPRSGYMVALRCSECRKPVRCLKCAGPMRRDQQDNNLRCGWCNQIVLNWQCECGSTKLLAPIIGAQRTVEEIARAFPKVEVFSSAGDKVLSDIPDQLAIVVATVGGEPISPTGYAAALLLDTEISLSFPSLRVGEEALRRWFNAISLVRPAEDGGTVLAVGESKDPYLQYLVKLDPSGAAEQELQQRVESGFPPAVKMIAALGNPEAIRQFSQADFGDAEIIGPVPRPIKGEPDSQMILLRTDLASAKSIVKQAKIALSYRSAHRMGGGLRVRVDPLSIG